MIRSQSLSLVSCSHCFRHVPTTVRSLEFPAMRTAPERLCPLESILDAAGGVLDFSYHLIGLALGFQLGIAKHLAGNLLDFTFDFLHRSLDTIFVHDLFSKKVKPPRWDVRTIVFQWLGLLQPVNVTGR